MPKSTQKIRKIYMDYAASIEANPSSIHSFGADAKRKLENARKVVADALSARPEEIVFTSGGTESNNLAIQGVVYPYLTSPYSRGRKKEGVIPHIITTNIEHPSVLETFKLLEKWKLARISLVPVEENGIVNPKKIRKEIKESTVLVSVMYANNEIGTIQPVREIAKEIRHWKKNRKKQNFHQVLGSPGPRAPARPFENLLFPVFHTDAVQAVNYLDLNVQKLGVDLLSLSGSKIEGAGRVGVLYKKKSVPLANIFGGGNQEFGFRPGTENLPEILKFAKALQIVQKIKEKETKRLAVLRDYFFAKLSRTVLDIRANGDLKNRLPNNVNITVPNIPSDLLVIELSARGVMASAKSACQSGDRKVSHVIKAINKNIKETDGSLRFSFGRKTTKADIDYTVRSLSQILTKLKKWYD